MKVSNDQTGKEMSFDWMLRCVVRFKKIVDCRIQSIAMHTVRGHKFVLPNDLLLLRNLLNELIAEIHRDECYRDNKKISQTFAELSCYMFTYRLDA